MWDTFRCVESGGLDVSYPVGTLGLMNLREAVETAKRERRNVRRPHWTGNKFVGWWGGRLTVHNPNGPVTDGPYAASSDDILADDWQVV